jgi:hypothetical protein
MSEKPPALERWLEIATKNLTEEGKARVRVEITQHYEEQVAEWSKLEMPSDLAASEAIADLGNPKLANRRLKRSHLTIREQRRVMGILEEKPSIENLKSLAFLTLFTLSLSLFCFLLGQSKEGLFLLLNSAFLIFWAGQLLIPKIKAPLKGRALLLILTLGAQGCILTVHLPIVRQLVWAYLVFGFFILYVSYAIVFWFRIYRKLGDKNEMNCVPPEDCHG